jgi:class 3 adenylate cyclase
MDERTLEQRLSALAGYSLIGEQRAKRFGEWMRAQDDWGLFRVNPLNFAKQNDVPQREAVDLFVHAARVGLFDFAFNQLCPYCGGVAFTRDTLSAVSRKFHCTTCDVTHDSSLDDVLEVAFTVNPAVNTLKLDPYASAQAYSRCFMTQNRKVAKEALDFILSNLRGFVSVPPDGKRVAQLTTKVGEDLAFLSTDAHRRVNIRVVEGGPLQAQISFLQHGADTSEIQVGPGALTVELSNVRAGWIGGNFRPNFVGQWLQQNFAKYPSSWLPYLTGKMLLNNQSFRDLFRVQSLAPDLQLNLKSLTLLFTDLKGSTELYDRTGDVYAYQVVQEHFKVLSEAVRKHDGAIVKTMGDAIMASFSSSRDAVAAAVDMMQAMEAVNAKVKADGHETGLKVGLHEGSALAVNAEARLDYFGQTVNIAARVQALAASGEIWLTESVLAADGVDEALQKSGYSKERKVVALKGVGTPTPVFRCVT